MIDQILSGAAQIICLSSSLPETWHILKSRLTRDLSLHYLTMVLIGQVVWVVYSVYVGNWIFTAGEGFDGALWGIIWFIALMNYKREKSEKREKESLKQKERPVTDLRATSLRNELKGDIKIIDLRQDDKVEGIS